MNKFLILILFLLISPIIIISMIMVYFEDGRPLILSQDRIGLNKKVFKLYKIRTMYNSAPLLGTHEVSKSHYLKVGRLLRAVKVDELPQVINYLKGELNIVGPRPGMPNQDKLTEEREKQNIFKSMPGITGLSQILGYDMSNPELLAKVDRLYIENKSIRLDINIVIATFIVSRRNSIKNRFIDEIVKFENV